MDIASRPLGSRGSPVTAAVFEATFEEIARVGLGGLTRELVAERAGVHKSTVYRRWPTTRDLVTEAFAARAPDMVQRVLNTGSLRGDLVELVMELWRLTKTAHGRAAVRVFIFDQQVPELADAKVWLDAEEDARGPKLIIDRAVGRGELPPGTDRAFLVDTIRGAVLYRMLTSALVDRAYAEQLVDALLEGVLHKGPEKKAKRRPARRSKG